MNSRQLHNRICNTINRPSVNGEKGYYRRYDIIGAIKDENIPDFAKENLAKFSLTDAQSETDAPAEDGGMTMGGM